MKNLKLKFKTRKDPNAYPETNVSEGNIFSPFDDAYWLRYFAAAVMSKSNHWVHYSDSVIHAKLLLEEIKRVEAENER